MVEWARCTHALGRTGRWFLDRKSVIEGESISCEAVGDWDEALCAEETYVCLCDERRICLVELVDASRKERVKDKGSRILDGKTHHYTFIAAVCTLRPASVPIIPTTFDTVALAAVTIVSATVSKLWGLWRRGCESLAGTRTPCICRDAEQGGT